jgi:hypothetical protein
MVTRGLAPLGGVEISPTLTNNIEDHDMARKIKWEVDGQTVTTADVRRWMQAVAARIPECKWARYIKDYDVVRKIATVKATGCFEEVIRREASFHNVKVRAPRRLGTLQRLRKTWADSAANAESFGGAACHDQATAEVCEVWA